MQNTKRCRWCNQEKPLEDFRNKIHCKREFGSLCSECRPKRNAANRAQYQKAGQRAYREQEEKRRALLAQSVPEGTKRCRTCLNVKASSEFWIQPNKTTRISGGPSNYCDGCRTKRREDMQRRRETWTAEQREKHRASQRRIAAGIKKQVIEHYGGTCACCGVSEIEFLTLDHINRDGALERAGGINGSRFYRYVIRKGFPNTYRCLCWNCNWANFAYGYCPHQAKMQLVI